MDYRLNLGNWNSIFGLPCEVVDKHLRLASGNQIKALLYVCRNAGNQLNLQHLSKTLSVSVEDAADCIKYWVVAGILAISGDDFVPAPASEPADSDKSQEKTVKPISEKKQTKIVASRPKPHSPAEIAERAKTDEGIRFLLTESEQLFGRPITQSEMGMLVSLHDWLGLSVEVILMIIQYAVANGKGNLRYIERMAISWADEGINTLEQAEEMLIRTSMQNEMNNKVMSIFGIKGRNLTASEKNYIQRWTKEWKFSEELITLAFERTVDRTGKLSLGYINKILESWHKNNIKTYEQALAEEKPSKLPATTKADNNKRKSYSFDIDEYERSSWSDTGSNES